MVISDNGYDFNKLLFAMGWQPKVSWCCVLVWSKLVCGL